MAVNGGLPSLFMHHSGLEVQRIGGDFKVKTNLVQLKFRVEYNLLEIDGKKRFSTIRIDLKIQFAPSNIYESLICILPKILMQ